MMKEGIIKYCTLTSSNDPGTILEISLRVGVIPLNVTPRRVFCPLISVCTHKETSNLFKELYLLYFVQKICLNHWVRLV